MRINAAGLKNREVAEALIAEAAELVKHAEEQEMAILEIVNANINK